MDIVGPLLEAPGKIMYLIVAVDYFTKWIEANAVTSITGKHVKNFAFDNIVCKFGIPATIITENGTQLINDPFKSWAEGLGIQLISMSVYHPQANRDVERANQSIMTTPKTSNEETPFSLAYGTEAVIPAKFRIPATIITENGTQLINDPFKSWAEGLGIQLISTSVYHPQANRDVERANQSIMTTPKTSNEETPFSLAYGTEAVIPAEIDIPTKRIIQRSDEENEEALRMNLKMLKE
nr:hypothetical protein [Tanacetum cinerariifolium]